MIRDALTEACGINTLYITCMSLDEKEIDVQWRFQSSQVTRTGDTRGMRGRLMGGEKSGPSP